MKPPERLKNAARRKWIEAFTNLSPATPLDTELACQYCESFEVYLKAQAILNSKGEGLIKTSGKNGAPYQHPAVGIMNKAIDSMRRNYELLKDKIKSEDDEDDLV